MAPFRKIQIKPPASKLLSLPAGALAPLMLQMITALTA